MIYLQSDHLNTAHAQFNLPMIGYQSLLRINDFASVNAEDINYPLRNLWTPTTHDFWRDGGDDGGIVLYNPPGNTFDYIGIAGHNFYTAGIQFRLWIASNTGAWQMLFDYQTALDDLPILIALNAQNTYLGSTTANNYYKLLLDFNQPGSARAQIAHIKLGTLLRLPFKEAGVGYKPSFLYTQVVGEGQMSDSGCFLGRINKNTYREGDISQQHNSKDFVFGSVVPFLRHCDKRLPDNGTAQETFFYCPRPGENPTGTTSGNYRINDVSYAWKKSITAPANQDATGRQSWGLSFRALA